MEKSVVQFGYADRLLPLNGKRMAKEFVADLVWKEGRVPCNLQYVFCSDAYLHNMNLSYLNHDDFTDIITFDLSNNPSQRIVGEIYISVDRVKENAQVFAVPFEKEILRVIFHGALHLCGFKDKKRVEIETMRLKEEEYLSLFFK